jgi:hypothetical protein
MPNQWQSTDKNGQEMITQSSNKFFPLSFLGAVAQLALAKNVNGMGA